MKFFLKNSDGQSESTSSKRYEKYIDLMYSFFLFLQVRHQCFDYTSKLDDQGYLTINISPITNYQEKRILFNDVSQSITIPEQIRDFVKELLET